MREAMKCLAGLMALAILLFVTACGKTEVSDTVHVQRAKQFQIEGKLNASFIELKNALQKNPNNSEARLLLGELYVRTGNGGAGEKELRKAQEMGVQGVYLQSLLAESLLLQHRASDALALLDGRDTNSHPQLQVVRGEALLALGKDNDALMAFQRALELNPDNVSALLWIVRTSLATGKTEEANKFLQRAVALQPNNEEAWVLKGQLARKQKRYSVAQDAYQRAIDLATSDLPLAVDMEARTEMASLLILEKKYEEAAAHVAYLLKLAPAHPISNYIAALLAFQQGRYAAARDYAQISLKAAPDYLQSIFLLGSSNFALDNLEQAEIQLARVVAEAPHLLPARLLLAAIHLQQEHSVQALEVLGPALEQTPNDVRLLALAGEAALQSGALDRSQQLIKRAIAKRPSSGGLRAQLAMLYLTQGNDEQAIQELEDTLARGEGAGQERALLALAYLRSKQYEKATTIAEKLVEDLPDNPIPQNLLGVILSAKGEIHKAQEAFSTALRINPTYDKAILNLVRLDILAGRLDDARERLEKVLVRDAKNVSAMMALAQLADAEGNDSEAFAWLEKARQADPEAITPRLVLARLYLRKKQAQKARIVLDEILRMDPDNPKGLMALGEVALIQHDVPAAIAFFARAVKVFPNAESYYWLGVAHVRANNIADARRSFSKALQQAPAYVPAIAMSALLDLKAGKTGDALKKVKRIRARQRSSPISFELEGDIRLQMGQAARAIKAFEQARKQGGGSRVVIKEADARRQVQGIKAAIEGLQEWLGHHKDDIDVRFYLAHSYVAAGRREAAIEEFQRLLALAPRHVAALNDLAWLLSEENRFDEARRLAEKAHKLNTAYGPAMDTLGWISYRQGDLLKAEELLQEAFEKMSDNQDTGYHLAQVLVARGKVDEGRSLLVKLLRSHRTFAERKNARLLLDSLQDKKRKAP